MSKRARSRLPVTGQVKIECTSLQSSHSRPKKKPRQKDYSCYISFADLIIATQTDKDCVEFCQSHGLIPRWIKCPKCGVKLDRIHYIQEKCRESYRKMFRCNKRSCSTKISALKNTWFERRAISLKKCLHLAYLFLLKADIETAKLETSGRHYGNQETGCETIVDSFYLCREVMNEALYKNQTFSKIGGKGLVVELDEVTFGRKWSKSEIELGQWILGGVCQETKDSFLVPLDDRSDDMLFDEILKHIAEGSVIHTDSINTFTNIKDKLEKIGYTYEVLDFKNNPDRQLQFHYSFENNWLMEKKSLRWTKKTYIGSHLAEFMWRKKHNLDFCRFTSFLNDIAKIYPGHG